MSNDSNDSDDGNTPSIDSEETYNIETLDSGESGRRLALAIDEWQWAYRAFQKIIFTNFFEPHGISYQELPQRAEEILSRFVSKNICTSLPRAFNDREVNEPIEAKLRATNYEALRSKIKSGEQIDFLEVSFVDLKNPFLADLHAELKEILTRHQNPFVRMHFHEAFNLALEQGFDDYPFWAFPSNPFINTQLKTLESGRAVIEHRGQEICFSLPDLFEYLHFVERGLAQEFCYQGKMYSGFLSEGGLNGDFPILPDRFLTDLEEADFLDICIWISKEIEMLQIPKADADEIIGIACYPLSTLTGSACVNFLNPMNFQIGLSGFQPSTYYEECLLALWPWLVLGNDSFECDYDDRGPLPLANGFQTLFYDDEPDLQDALRMEVVGIIASYITLAQIAPGYAAKAASSMLIIDVIVRGLSNEDMPKILVMLLVSPLSTQPEIQNAVSFVLNAAKSRGLAEEAKCNVRDVINICERILALTVFDGPVLVERENPIVDSKILYDAETVRYEIEACNTILATNLELSETECTNMFLDRGSLHNLALIWEHDLRCTARFFKAPVGPTEPLHDVIESLSDMVMLSEHRGWSLENRSKLQALRLIRNQVAHVTEGKSTRLAKDKARSYITSFNESLRSLNKLRKNFAHLGDLT